MSKNPSTLCRLPQNHRPFFRSLSLSSALGTVTFALGLYLSSFSRMFSIALDESNHQMVYARVMLSDPASISGCIFLIPFGCQPYLSRSTTCTRRWWDIWCLIMTIISGFNFLAARRGSSRYSRNNMLLIAAVPIDLIRFSFLLYSSLWVIICAHTLVAHRTLLIFRAMSAAAPHFSNATGAT